MPHYQVARVAVSPDTWQRFRQVALVRGLSVAAYLGQLVERELQRRADSPLVDVQSDEPPADQTLTALAAVRQNIDELDDIAGRLARSAVAHGGSWSDIASSLRLTEQQARRAYDRE